MNWSIGQIVRSMISPDQLDWYDKLPMVEFALNSSVSSTTGYAPFELAATHMPRMIERIDGSKIENKGIKEFVELALERLNDAYGAIVHQRVFQKVKADRSRREEPEIKTGDRVYLSTKDLALPKGRAGKFLPKYIGPYLVLDARPESSTYKLDLSKMMKQRNIHDVFHVSKLRPYLANDEAMFPGREEPGVYDFGEPDEETGVLEIDGHRWRGNKIELHVRWDDGDETWETGKNMNDCVAVDAYLELKGVKEMGQLERSAVSRKTRSAGRKGVS
jgi:hypothetical protein